MTTNQTPSLLNLALEGRAILEWASYLALRPWLEAEEAGDGHPVLVLPGLLTNDLYMAPMRAFLETSGFTPYAWEQGFNTGPSKNVLRALEKRVRELHKDHQEPVSLVGWSMGGAISMALASRMPEKVRSVVTLGSPLSAKAEHSSIAALYERISGLKANDPRLQALAQGHPDVPTTSLVSKGDGVVSWQGGILNNSPRHETVVIKAASHLGLPVHTAALIVVADRLRQTPQRWRRFAPPEGLMASLTERLPRRPSRKTRP